MEEFSSQEALQAAIQQHPIVIVQFGSVRCAPCKALQSRIRLWTEARPEVGYVYIDAEEHPELCGQMGVFTVPTIYVYAEGRLTQRQSGYFSLDHMLQQVDKYRRLLGF